MSTISRVLAGIVLAAAIAGTAAIAHRSAGGPAAVPPVQLSAPPPEHVAAPLPAWAPLPVPAPGTVRTALGSILRPAAGAPAAASVAPFPRRAAAPTRPLLVPKVTRTRPARPAPTKPTARPEPAPTPGPTANPAPAAPTPAPQPESPRVLAGNQPAPSTPTPPPTVDAPVTGMSREEVRQRGPASWWANVSRLPGGDVVQPAPAPGGSSTLPSAPSVSLPSPPQVQSALGALGDRLSRLSLSDD